MYQGDEHIAEEQARGHDDAWVQRTIPRWSSVPVSVTDLSALYPSHGDASTATDSAGALSPGTGYTLNLFRMQGY